MKKFTHTSTLLGLVFWFLVSCSSKNNVEIIGGVKVEQDANALRKEIAFQTDKAISARVKYWLDDKVFSSVLSSSKTEHNIVLVGLKANATYKYQIELIGEKGTDASDEMEFKTSILPEDLPIIDWKLKSDNAFEGYFLTQKRFVNGSIYLVDSDGDIVWYQNVPKQPKLANWTQNGTILTLSGDPILKNSAGDKILEYDLYGNQLLELDLTKISTPIEAHHDVIYNSENRLVMLVYEERVFDLSGVGGQKEQAVLGDAIVVLDKDGTELWKWSVFDYADPAQDDEILSKKKGKFSLLKRTFDDWSHANAISIDRDGNYLVSFKNWDQVWKIDAQNGEVIWKLGRNGNIDMPSESYFSDQHSIHLNENGDYMLFDNGKAKRLSRVLSFAIDETKGEANVKLKIDLPRDFFADRMGSAYLMPNGNILVCAPKAYSVIVIDKEGKLLSNAYVGLPDPYRAEYVPTLYPNHRE